MVFRIPSLLTFTYLSFLGFTLQITSGWNMLIGSKL